jgi:hypothetical protein
MSSRRVDVYFIRFAKLANVGGFLYLTWVINATDLAGPRSRTEMSLTNCVLLLAVAPFLVALITTLRKELTRSQWLLIRATHQALAIVTIAVAVISLVGLPDTAPVTISVTVIALLQVAALKASGQFVLGGSQVKSWPIKLFRLAMVFLFAFLFLLMK